jgi:hypothetical protein
MNAARSDDALGYSGVNRDGVARPRLVVADEQVAGDRKDHRRICDGQHGARHGAHRTALHAAVVIGRRRARIGSPMLSVHSVMVVLAIASGLIMVVRDVGAAVRAAGGHGRRQLQPGALPPGRRAGDKRKRHGQNHDMVKHASHPAMLSGPAESRQEIFDRLPSTTDVMSVAGHNRKNSMGM